MKTWWIEMRSGTKMERIEMGSMKRSEKLSGRWLRSFCRGWLVPIAAVSVLSAVSMLASFPALAATTLNFVSSDGQFSIADGQLTFTNDLTISTATVDGVSDESLMDAKLALDPILLTGESTPIEGGFVEFGIVAEPLMLTIRQAADAGGAPLASAVFLPGDLRVFGAGGELSSVIAAGTTDFFLEPAGDTSSVLASFAASADPIEIELTLSAAGQDIAALIDAGSAVTGSAGGSMAIVPVPEPSAAALAGAAMATLLVVTGLRRRGRAIDPAGF